MTMTDKETAFQIIERLPDDASLDQIHEALDSHKRPPATNPIYTPPIIDSDKDGDPSQPVERRPVKKGFITVLEPVRPLPRVSVELVNYIIEQTRREREDRFLGLTEENE